MRTRTITGLALFVLGYAAFVVSFRVTDLMPRVAYETEAVDALITLHDNLTLQVDANRPAPPDAPPLAEGLRGEDLFAAAGLPREFALTWAHIPAAGFELRELDLTRRTFQIRYDGREIDTPGVCRALVTHGRPGRIETSRDRLDAAAPPWIFAIAALGLIAAVLGLWLSVSSILVRSLVLDMLRASLAGIAGLTLILFLGASLQFIDRFSFLGPGFFFGAIPMLLAQVLPYTISFGVLAGVTMVYGRMANDREENILQFNGIRLGVLVLPALIIGVLFTGITFHAALYWAPAGAYAQDRLPVKVLAASLDNLPTGTFAFGDSRLPFAMAYKNRSADGKLHGLSLLLLKRDAEDNRMEPVALFCAESGRLVWSETLAQVRFELEKCITVNWRSWPEDPFPRSSYSASLAVSQTVFATTRSDARMRQLKEGTTFVPVNPGIQRIERRAKTDTTRGLRERAERVAAIEERRDRERERHLAAAREQELELARIRRDQETRLRQALTAEQWQITAGSPALPPPGQPLTRRSLQQLLQSTALPPEAMDRAMRLLAPLTVEAEEIARREIPPAPPEASRAQRAETELYKRIAVALSPILFTLIALPLGLLIRQGNLLVAFMVAVLLVGLTWFIVLTNMEKLGREGDAPAYVVLLWPTVSVFGTGLVLSLMAFGGISFRRSKRPDGPEGQTTTDPVTGARMARLFRASESSTATAIQRPPGDSGTGSRVPMPPTEAAKRDMTRPHLRPPTQVQTYAPKPKIRRAVRLLPAPVAAALAHIRHGVSGSTIERYIIRGTLASLIASFLTVVVLFIVADTMVNVDYFRHVAESRADTSYSEIAWQYYTSRVPQIMYMVGPLVTLFALSFTLTRFVRSNEYLVLQAMGVSTWRVLRPMLMVSAAVAALMLSWNQWGSPYVAEQMRKNNSYMERRGQIDNRVLTDIDGRMFWIRHYDARQRTMTGVMVVNFDQTFPPRVAIAWPVGYRAAGWTADHWREMTLTERAFEGERIHTFDVVASSDPIPDSRGGQPVSDDDVTRARVIDPSTGAIDTLMRPADVNRRVTQILEDRAITELWDMSVDQPDWNAPQVMFHRAFIYPLSNLILFLIGMPLVLRVAGRSAWHGVGFSVILAVLFYAAMISLSGWGLFSTGLSPGVILWVGISPFILAGIRMFSDVLQ